jgi:hypothetical protein
MAINRLRAANLAAEKADDEKFALSDSIGARISEWRDGRGEGLRALFGGLDQVLWKDSGWERLACMEFILTRFISHLYPISLSLDSYTALHHGR